MDNKDIRKIKHILKPHYNCIIKFASKQVVELKSNKTRETDIVYMSFSFIHIMKIVLMNKLKHR